MDKFKEIMPDYHDAEFLCPKTGLLSLLLSDRKLAAMSAVWDTDYLWREVQGAKLASLFGLDRAESQGNESFQFTAPKQPKKTCTILGPPQKPAPPPCAPAVLYATAVHAFCFVNGQYVKQGKIGAAVLGNHITKEYKILLYGSKQKQITTARIYCGFVLTIQPCNYVTFYDDQQQSWSLMFDSEKSRPEFCKEVCVARWNSEASPDSLVTQDLVQGEGQAVNVGDTVEVAYSGWLLQNHSLGQIFDSNLGKEKLQRVKLGAGKALRSQTCNQSHQLEGQGFSPLAYDVQSISKDADKLSDSEMVDGNMGWEDGMLGMQKGGRRLLIVPPSMVSKGVPNHVPENSTLVFDVQINRVKLSKERHCGGSVDTFSTSPGACPDTQSKENTSQLVTTDTDESKDQAPKGKVGSVAEYLISSGAAKAKLISRIAKMGQPMLPFLTGAIRAQPDPSESETEDASVSGRICSPSHTPSPKPAQMPPSLLCQPDDAQKLEAVPPNADSNTTQGFQVCQHNTGILLALEKLARRMDQLTCKVDELQKDGHFSSGFSSVSLETNMILHNIQRLIQESMCLKKEVLEKNSQVEEQNCKIGELSGQNKSFMGQQHTQTRRLQAEQETVHLSRELSSSTTQTYQLLQEMVNLQQRVTEIQADLSAALEDKHKHCAQISLLEEQLKELVKQEEQSERRWTAEKKKCKDMETIIQNMDEKMQDLRAEKKNLDPVKRVMNGVFQSLRTEFDPEESYSGHTVCEILQNTIKSITMKLLSEVWEIESDLDKVEEEYPLRSIEEVFSDGKHAEGKP